MKQKVIKVLTKGTGGLPAPYVGYPDIDRVLTLGGDDYCAKADVPPQHFKEIADKLIKSKNRLAPGACPVVPPTTSFYIVPTTTTTLPPHPLDHYGLYPALRPDDPFVHIED